MNGEMDWTGLICSALRLGWDKTAKRWYREAKKAGATLDDKRIRETAQKAKEASR